MAKSVSRNVSIDSTAWDAFAKHQPYFHILSHPRMIDPAAADQLEFWNSGDRDVKGLQEFAGLQPVDGRGVDFGCGLGRLTRALRSLTAHQTGLDISADMLAQAREANRDSPTIEFRHIQDGRWPVADESCELAISKLVFQHLSSAELMQFSLREMGRVLTQGGRAVFQIVTTTPAGECVTALRQGLRMFRSRREDQAVARLIEKLERAATDTGQQFSDEEIQLMFVLDCRRIKSFPLRRLKRELKNAGMTIDRVTRDPDGSTLVAATKAVTDRQAGAAPGLT